MDQIETFIIENSYPYELTSTTTSKRCKTLHKHPGYIVCTTNKHKAEAYLAKTYVEMMDNINNNEINYYTNGKITKTIRREDCVATIREACEENLEWFV